MSGSLIIDAHHRLPWHQRLFTTASTALLWSGWLCLWLPLLRAWASVADLGVRVAPPLGKLMVAGGDGTLRHSVVALIGTSGTLLVWNRLPARRVPAAPALSVPDYARHFGLPEHELRAAHGAAVCVVHHDEHGRLVRLEQREPAPRVERTAA